MFGYGGLFPCPVKALFVRMELHTYEHQMCDPSHLVIQAYASSPEDTIKAKSNHMKSLL